MALYDDMPSSPTFSRDTVLFPGFERCAAAQADLLSEDEDELASLRYRQSNRGLFDPISTVADWPSQTEMTMQGSTSASTTTRRVKIQAASPRRSRHSLPSAPAESSQRPRSHAHRRRRTQSTPIHLSDDLWHDLPPFPPLLPDTAAALQRAAEAVQVGFVALLGAAALWTLVGVLVASYGLTAIDSLGAGANWLRKQRPSRPPTPTSDAGPGSSPRPRSSRHPPRPPLTTLVPGIAFTLLVAASDQLANVRARTPAASPRL